MKEKQLESLTNTQEQKLFFDGSIPPQKWEDFLKNEILSDIRSTLKEIEATSGTSPVITTYTIQLAGSNKPIKIDIHQGNN